MTNDRVNEQIRASEVLLIDNEGERMGVYDRDEALNIADQRGWDLVEVAPDADPPVCRLLDYGKLKYERKKKRKEQKQKSKELKEISVSMKIGEHDLQTKVRKAKEFLEDGHKVKVNLLLRGREKAFAESRGVDHLKDIAERFEDVAKMEKLNDKLVGNRIHMILAPDRN